MDLLVGSVGFHDAGARTMLSSSSSNEDEGGGDRTENPAYRAFMMQELAKSSERRRNGYEETHARIKVKAGQALSFEVGGGSGKRGRIHNNDSTSSSEPTLERLPEDLRRHLRSEALRSRSPLSSAAAEEHIDKAAPRSSDFLLRVASSAAGEEAGVSSPWPSAGALEALRVAGHRRWSARPWWVLSPSATEASLDDVSGASEGQPHDTQDADGHERRHLHPSETLTLKGGSTSRGQHPRHVLGSARKRAVAATSLILLVKAPILSAALIVAAVASGFSSSQTPLA